MWKPNQPGTGTGSQGPEPTRPATPATPGFEASARPAPVPAQSAGEQATIGKSLVVKGEVTGSESLYVDGKVEGAINLPGNRVTVGRNGQVAANITAREIVVLGKVRGNCHRQRSRRHPQRRLAHRRRHSRSASPSKTAPSSRAVSTSASRARTRRPPKQSR
jgi:hypothetical protein